MSDRSRRDELDPGILVTKVIWAVIRSTRRNSVSKEAAPEFAAFQVPMMQLESYVGGVEVLHNTGAEKELKQLHIYLGDRAITNYLKAVRVEVFQDYLNDFPLQQSFVLQRSDNAYDVIRYYEEVLRKELFINGRSGDFVISEEDFNGPRKKLTLATEELFHLISNADGRQWVRLVQAVPAQQIAPVYFDVADTKIILKPVQSDISEQDRGIADIARTQAIESGRRLIEYLQDPTKTQFSKRYLDQLIYLQDKLEKDGNAIAVAMANVPCTLIVQEMKDEIADDLQGLMTGHAINVHGYVAQFPDFRQYSDNINSLKITQEDIAEIQSGFDRFLKVIEENLDHVDNAVLDALKRLRDFLAMAGEKKTSVFAVLRTIGNWISNGFQHIKPFFSKLAAKTSEKTIDGLATVISGGVTLVFLGLVYQGIATISPTAVKVPEFHWVQQFEQFIGKRITELTKSK